MARDMTFQIKRSDFQVTPVKVDRKKLYGWTEILAVDEKGRECKLVTTNQTGTLIIPRGGTSMAILTREGNWVERSSLLTIKEDGKPADLIPSSYSHPVKLTEKVTEDDFLDHSITDFYQLTGAAEDFSKALGNDIYSFEYTYLDSYETSPAFIMLSDEGIPFMLVGYKNKFTMLCLGDCSKVDEEDDDFIDVTDDDIDFTMF